MLSDGFPTAQIVEETTTADPYTEAHWLLEMLVIPTKFRTLLTPLDAKIIKIFIFRIQKKMR